MDILIKNMEMPSNCYDCMLLRVCKESIDNYMHEYKSENCPLIPVPEHGRLVDADKLLADHPKTANWDYMVLECIIRNAPTVVEAS